MPEWSWVLVGLSLIGAIFNNYKNYICFYIYLVCNTGWIYIAIKNEFYQQVALFLLYSIISVHGLIRWRKDKK